MDFKGGKHMESNMFSLEHIENIVIPFTYEPPSSEYNFETRYQASISPSDKGILKQEEELTQFNGKQIF